MSEQLCGLRVKQDQTAEGVERLLRTVPSANQMSAGLASIEARMENLEARIRDALVVGDATAVAPELGVGENPARRMRWPAVLPTAVPRELAARCPPR